MSVLFEILVNRAAPTDVPARIPLEKAFGETFLPEYSGSQHQNWSSVKYDVDLTPSACVMTNRQHWWSFCTDLEIRRKCLSDALKLAQVFQSDTVIFAPENAQLAANSLDGWSMRQMTDHLASKFGTAQRDFKLFDGPGFGTVEEQEDKAECYFLFELEELSKMLESV